MRLANDERLMRDLKNTRFYNILGWTTFELATTAVLSVFGLQIYDSLAGN
jgi:Mn2+/Fe2+ NRAMP family transporter